MRVQEVEEIIGAPPGWYDGVYGIAGSLGHEDDKDRRRIWVGQDGKIVVVFDFNGRVGAAEFSKVQVIAREPLAMIWERVTRGLLK
jgi:hypothetical protein